MMTAKRAGIRLRVSGYGMVSALGHDAATGCSAARAGLSRAGEMPEMRFADPATGDQVPLAVHAIWGIADGFTGLGRLIQIGHAGLRDMMARNAAMDWRDTGIMLLLTDGFHLMEAARLTERLSEEAAGTVEETADQLRRHQEIMADRLLPAILKQAGVTVDAARCQVAFGGNAGLIGALTRCAEMLYSGGMRRVVIGALHSELDPDRLAALQALGLLKTPSNPVGCMPGEMAAFLVVEPDNPGARNSAAPGVLLDTPAHAKAPCHRFSTDPPLGTALAETINATLGGAPKERQRCDLVIGDLNGDAYRAQEWGSALVRLIPEHPWLDTAAEWYPALPFGDIGVATGPAAVCMAARAFERGYAAADQVLVWLFSNDGGRGAFRISPQTQA